MTKQQLVAINNFMISFLENIGADTEAWKSPENMKKFKSLFKSTRKIKDKDKPKRALSAYLYFCKDKRQGVKERMGKNAPTTSITTELGKMWRDLKQSPDCDSLIAPYQKLADEDKKRYEAEMEGYVPPTQAEIKKKRKKSKTKGPKRVRTAYIFFCSDHRQRAKLNLEGKDSSAKAVTCELGRMWREFKKSCTEEEMNKYVQLYEDDKKRFEADIALSVPDDYESLPKSTPIKKTLPPPTRSVVSAKKSNQDTPKKSGALAYRRYVKANRSTLKEQFPDMKAREITSTLGKQWKALSDEEKQEWDEK